MRQYLISSRFRHNSARKDRTELSCKMLLACLKYKMATNKQIAFININLEFGTKIVPWPINNFIPFHHKAIYQSTTKFMRNLNCCKVERRYVEMVPKLSTNMELYCQSLEWIYYLHLQLKRLPKCSVQYWWIETPEICKKLPFLILVSVLNAFDKMD
jgi:hypothetical protein